MRALLPFLLLSSLTQALPAQSLDSARTAMSAPAAAIEPSMQVVVPAPRRAPRTTASTKTMVAGGIIGGALGAFGGAMVGKAIADCDERVQHDCALTGLVVGGILGEAIGVPIGVNFVSNGRNTLHRSIPTSVGVTVASLALGVAGYYAFIPALPGLQLYTSINIERSGKIGLLGR
jgi:hypothetical protein